MNKKLLEKSISLALTICFSATTFALPVLARPGRGINQAPRQQVQHHTISRGPGPVIEEPRNNASHRGSSSRPRPNVSRPANSSPRPNPGSTVRNPNRPNPGSTVRGPHSANPGSTVRNPNRPNGNRPNANRPGVNHPNPNGAGVNRPNGNRPNPNAIGPNRPGPNRPGINRPGPNRPGIHRPGPNRPGGPHFEHNRPYRPYHYRPYPYWRRSGIIFHFGYPRAHFWWGCRHGVSFGDYLVMAMIVAAARQATMDDVYSRHLKGDSYEAICNDYDVDWSTINTNARVRFNEMNLYASNRGVSFWGWNDVLTY